MNPSLRIHVCSSNRDLASERHALLQWLEDMRVRTPGFGYFGSRGLPALDTALQDIAQCDAIILLVGHLYGMMAPGHQRSQEEREYEEARKQGKAVFVYLRDEEAAKVPGTVERDPVRIPLHQDFRKRLQEAHAGPAFKDSGQLIGLVEADILALCQARGMERRPVSKPMAPSRLRTSAADFERTPVSAHDPSASAVSVAAAPGSSDGGTQTLPLLQKALSTPFSPGGPPRVRKTAMGGAVGFLALVGVGIGLWKGPWLQRLTPPAQAPLQTGSMTPADTVVFDSMVAVDTVKTSSIEDSASLQATAAPDPLTVLFNKAKEGDSTALFRLGAMYDSGLTLPQDDSLATAHYRKAASQGMAEAQYQLGLRHLEGKGAKRSKAQAIYWLQAAATKGYVLAESRLGLMYFKGQGVPKDEVQGLKWLLKAADQNDPEASRLLAEIKEH